MTRCAIIVVMMWRRPFVWRRSRASLRHPRRPTRRRSSSSSIGSRRRWARAGPMPCTSGVRRRAPIAPDDPVIQPAKIFDNVYAIGNVGTVAYVIQTSAGLMMIDALGANQVESDLLPGFTKLGLDPAQVKTILVAHGHADHFGGVGVLPAEVRFEGLRLGGGLDVDGDAAARPRPGSAAAGRAAQARWRAAGWRVSHARERQRARRRRARPHARLDGLHHSSPRSRRAARGRALRRIVADAGTAERRGDADLHRLGRVTSGRRRSTQASTRGCRTIR